MGNVIIEMDTLQKNQKEILEMKNTITEMKNAFGALISRPDASKESVSLRIGQYKFPKWKWRMKKTEYARTVRQFQSV